MNLSPKEQKLLVLALDRAAHTGEADNAALALVRSFKQRFGDGYQLLAQLEKPRPSESSGVDYGRTVMPFGKFRGAQIANVPPTYLLWILENCQNLDRPLRKAITRFLRDQEFPA